MSWKNAMKQKRSPLAGNVDRVNVILAYKGTVAPRYDSENVAEVLFRLNASIWKDVLPWCLCNTFLAAAVFYFNLQFAIATTDRGHSFMSLAVSYLLVTRTKICLERYMKQRGGLSDLTRTCKELVSHAISFTRFKNAEEDGTKWRCSVAKRTITLLKVIVSVLQYSTTKRNVWEIHDIPNEVKEALLLAVGKSNQRSPLVLTLFLRTVIASHTRKLKHKLDVNQELTLLKMTTDILAAYTEILTYINTPYPFPLVQMTRTILIIYIFTLPLALANDVTSLIPYLLLIFFITYGFIGMELICVEIDDPFGDDPNDFDVDAIAKTVYKDIIVFIADSDGKEAELAVKKSIGTKVDDEINNAVEQHDKVSTGEWGIISSDDKERARSAWRNIRTDTLVHTSAIIEKLRRNNALHVPVPENNVLPEISDTTQQQLDSTSSNLDSVNQSQATQTALVIEKEMHSKNGDQKNHIIETDSRTTEKEALGNKFGFTFNKDDSSSESVRYLNMEDDLSLGDDDDEGEESLPSPQKMAFTRATQRTHTRTMPKREFSRVGVSNSKIIDSTSTWKEHVRSLSGGTNNDGQTTVRVLPQDNIIFEKTEISSRSPREAEEGIDDDISYDSSSDETPEYSEDFLPL